MEKVTGSENRGPLSELETEAEAEEEEPGAAALEDPEEQPTSIPAAIAGEQACCQDGRAKKRDALTKMFFHIGFILPFQNDVFFVAGDTTRCPRLYLNGAGC